MWNGAFGPQIKKSTCQHGDIFVQVGEPELGIAPVRVQFNHTCAGGITPPSNSKTYTLEYQLDSFMDAEDEEAADLQRELDEMTSSEKLEWINQQLTGI